MPNSSRPRPSDPVEQALLDLVSSMHLVFDHDWQFSRDMLADRTIDLYIKPPRGTFLEPGVDDESNNWANRGYLLDTYRRAREVLRERGHDPERID